MVPNHGTQYEENPPSHQGGMHKDGPTDGWTDDWMLSYIARFSLGGAGNN